MYLINSFLNNGKSIVIIEILNVGLRYELMITHCSKFFKKKNSDLLAGRSFVRRQGGNFFWKRKKGISL